MSALLLNGILHGTSAVPPALIAATGQEYDPPGVAIILRVVAAESPLPTFLTLTVQKSDEDWVVFSITRSGAGAVFALAYEPFWLPASSWVSFSYRSAWCYPLSIETPNGLTLSLMIKNL